MGSEELMGFGVMPCAGNRSSGIASAPTRGRRANTDGPKESSGESVNCSGGHALPRIAIAPLPRGGGGVEAAARHSWRGSTAMRALQIQAPGRAEVVDIAMPQPGPGEVRVRVSLVNTCPQWDLHLDAGEPMFVGQQIPYPYTSGQPGHEMVGVVDAIGEGVTAFRVGQRVAAWRDAGHHRQGCYAEYVSRLEANILPVPDPVGSAIASLELAMCVAVSVLPLKRLGAIAGKRAAVNGLGPAG